jgi:lipopolysaccharide transport system ATP-binding protein
MWALEDLSFEVKKGEAVGVVGRNGAGKSTLLKLLSRITEPTKGYADIYGRVGSLLEVGTGFHQELSGRENIYLNGAIIGMKKAEIERKFDDIVDFAEVERFIDTPVKHYSSGMYLRLAFSVAAHLEPEILLVDEVLAVGDIAFQRKCLGKMEDVAAHGRTVLFVSHNLGAVRELCKTSIILSKGRLAFRGPVVEGLAHYSRGLAEDGEDDVLSGSGWHNVTINGRTDAIATSNSSDPFFTEVTLNLRDDFSAAKVFLVINDAVGGLVVHQRIDTRELGLDHMRAGRYKVRADLPALWLAPGIYTLHFKFMGRNISRKEDRYLSERVMLDVTGNVNGIGRATLAPPPCWTISRNNQVDEKESDQLCEIQI